MRASAGGWLLALMLALSCGGCTERKAYLEARRAAQQAPRSEPAPAPAAKPVPELHAQRLRAALVIDGTLDEAAWRSTESTGPMIQTMTGAPGAFAARARVLYDDARLYVGFDVTDPFLKSTFEHDDDHLWEQDTVEIMFDPDGDARNYFELQVSPHGLHFDTRYESRRSPRPFGHVDWDSQVEARTTVHSPDAAAAGSGEAGYTVELAVPFSAFATGDPPATAPTAGSSWRMNFFVMDALEQGQRTVGWSAPLRPDFHTLERFGRVWFMP